MECGLWKSRDDFATEIEWRRWLLACAENNLLAARKMAELGDLLPANDPAKIETRLRDAVARVAAAKAALAAVIN